MQRIIGGNGQVFSLLHQLQSMFTCIPFTTIFSKQRCMAYFRHHFTLDIWRYLAQPWGLCVEQLVTWEQVPLSEKSILMWKLTRDPRKPGTLDQFLFHRGGTCTTEKAQEEIWALTLGTLWVCLSWMAFKVTSVSIGPRFLVTAFSNCSQQMLGFYAVGITTIHG